LKSEEGYKIFMKLVAKADVLVENMRTPAKGCLKIAFDDLKKVNPRLVYGSISGFGKTGPYSQRGGAIKSRKAWAACSQSPVRLDKGRCA
jgi:crotonobetainyl-CoA:carnitine CoA-transferase CaiB-like acyl-CoA transferase